jgi:hypothetical protein
MNAVTNTIIHSCLSRAAICIQIMELIVDKKGADMETFKKIRADLERMRAQPSGGKSPPPPPAPASKRPRVG